MVTAWSVMEWGALNMWWVIGLTHLLFLSGVGLWFFIRRETRSWVSVLYVAGWFAGLAAIMGLAHQ